MILKSYGLIININPRRERPIARPTEAFAMRAAIAIVIAGALIAFHWQISAGTGVVYRLDSWTGRIIGCGFANPLGCQEIGFAR